MTNRWTGPAVLAAYALIWIVVATAAHGQVYGPTVASTVGECPVDKPIRRTVTQYQNVVTCTLLACYPKLVCGRDSDRCVYMQTDCNRCTPEPVDVTICLSQEELDKAR